MISMITTCDQDLILQMQNGSLEALGELYDRHRQVVYRTALAITGDGDAASDLPSASIRSARWNPGCIA